MFDLRARTKNIDIRRTIESLGCSMGRPAIISHDIQDTSQYKIQKPYPIIEYDELGNELTEKNHQQQLMFHRKEPVTHDFHINNHIVLLMHVGADNLPCLPVQDTNPTELPLPRESIGIDLSWLSSSSSRTRSLLNRSFFVTFTIISIIFSSPWIVS